MRRLAAGAALLLAAALAAPALADDPASGAPEASAPDANLFVYRDAARPAGCAAELLLDGKPFAALPQHSYTSIAVRPGFHDLEFRWPSSCGHGDVTDQLEIADRRLYYFALTGDAQLTRDALGGYTTNLHETTTLTPVDPDEGVQAVAACCRFVKASGRF
jgi:hypothetical protein